jgi:hypothetical protein
MKTFYYKLGDKQYIDDLDISINPEHYVTHLCADTGMGKSTWVLDSLTTEHRVLFAVPQRAQITQLQSRYKARNDIDFIYGGHTELSEYPLHIVCTYDQLTSLKAKLNTEYYLLVVDEVHKLYQAASYREGAVLPIIDAIKEKWFEQVLTLSATFTPSLVPYSIDFWLGVLGAVNYERCVELEVFHNLTVMEDALMDNFNIAKRGPTVIRLNNKEAMSVYKRVLEGRNLKCLAVNSDIQAMPDVVNMLKEESIAKYDVVLTTSLLDEAININDEVISELFIFNSCIHPEELKQFVGRFRLCCPKVRIYLLQNRFSGKEVSLDTIQKQTMNKALAAKVLLGDVNTASSPLQAVRKANQMLKEMIGFEPLRYKQSEVIVNEASIMARLYKANIAQCYQNEESLEERLKAVFQRINFNVTYIDRAEGQSESSSCLDMAYDEEEKNRKRILESCKERVMMEIKRKPTDLKNHQATVGLLSKLYKVDDLSSPERDILKCWHELHLHVLKDLWQAFDAIYLGQDKKIWQFHQAVEKNFYIKPILQSLQKLPIGTHMTMTEAREKILGTLRQVALEKPMFKELVAAAKVKNISVKRNNHFSVTDKFIRSIFRDYTVTPPVRSNNKDKIVFNGIGLFGYKYQLTKEVAEVAIVRRVIRKVRKNR